MTNVFDRFAALPALSLPVLCWSALKRHRARILSHIVDRNANWGLVELNDGRLIVRGDVSLDGPGVTIARGLATCALGLPIPASDRQR